MYLRTKLRILDFFDFGFEYDLEDGIEAMGYREPTPVQKETIPIILDNEDIIACAQTGTGKTAAFVLPLINKVLRSGKTHCVQGLVVVPTRELAMQISQQVEGMAYYADVSVMPIYGGNGGIAFAKEKIALENGVDIVVGTPGRLISHLQMDYVDTSSIETFVLDEADRMLDMGFLPDIKQIVNFLPEKRQTLLFTATMPAPIKTLAKGLLTNPKEVMLAVSTPVEKIKQRVYIVHQEQKIPIIADLIVKSEIKRGLIFCATKRDVKELFLALKRKKLVVGEMHADLLQENREMIMERFKNADIKVLVATDIVSRGIDIANIDVIINFNVPDFESYVHRIGRTARAEREGAAYTFVVPREAHALFAIERSLGKKIERAVIEEEYGEAPQIGNKKANNNRRTPNQSSDKRRFKSKKPRE